MKLLRSTARVLTASMYVTAGYAAVKDPGMRPQMAEGLLERVRRVVPLPEDDAQLVKLNGAVQAGAGATLAVGVLPRLSALALIGSLVPTTLAGHAFWTLKDPAQRAAQRTQFFKNLAMLGGLVYALNDSPKRRS